MTRPATFGVCVLAVALLSASCGGVPPFVQPSGAGIPAPDAAAAWNDATAGCRAVKTFSSELRLSGRTGPGRSVRQTVFVGVTDAGQIRLEAPAPFGRPIVTLAGTEERATLLTRDNRVLTAATRDIVDALTGLSLGPRALLAVLSGCGVAGDPSPAGVRHADMLALTVGGRRVFLRSVAGKWRVIAVELSGLLVDYSDKQYGAWPARIRLTSTSDLDALSLTAVQQQVEANRSFSPSDFTLTPPANATPMRLEELQNR